MHIKKSKWNDKKSLVMDLYWFGFDLFSIGEAFHPAPRKMSPKRIAATYRNPLVLKQPIARAGFRRGQRRIKKL